MRSPIRIHVLFISFSLMLYGCASNIAVSIRNGDINEVRSSINSSNVNSEDSAGTPLYKAIVFKRTNIAKMLIYEKGADVNHASMGILMPLNTAISQKATEIARMLIEKGANVNYVSKDGGTPLMFASIFDNVQVAKMLMAKGANVNSEDNDGNTPLSLSKSSEMTKLLVDKGAKSNARNKHGRTIAEQREYFKERQASMGIQR